MGRKFLKHFFSLLHADYVKLDTRWNYSNIVSPYYRLYYIDEGAGTISSSDTTLSLEPGFIYIIPSFTLCSLHCDKYLSQYFIQFFEESTDGISLFSNNRTPVKTEASLRDIEGFKRLLQINPGRGINRSDNPKVYEKDIYYKEYQELNDLQSLSVYFETQGILLQLVSSFLNSRVYNEANKGAIPSVIMEAISFIQINLEKPLTVAGLAARAHLHPDYFSRLFKLHTGKRPVTYIQEKRIQRAQYLIVTTNLSYLQIATDTGFESLSYFSRAFKAVTRTTPGEYRQLNKFV